jgi:hypothetical protein
VVSILFAEPRLSSDSSAASGSPCSCFKGTSKCTCGMKKDLKLDTNLSKLSQSSRPKPTRLTSANSETTLTFLQNGHHKPCHRLNNTAHTSGAPYRIPRSHTLGHHPLSADPAPALRDRRSVDDFGFVDANSLPLFSTSAESMSAFPTTTDAFYGSAQVTASIAASDPSSPIDSTPGEPFASQQWAWSTPTSQPMHQFSSEVPSSASPTQVDFPSTYENDWAIPSAGVQSSSIWSSGDLPLNPNRLHKTITPPISLSCDSNFPSAPGLTSGSSGEQSENGDGGYADNYDYSTSQTNLHDQIFDDVLSMRVAERATPYRINTAPKRPEFRQAPTSVPTGASRRSLDLDQMRSTSEVFLPTAGTSTESERPYSSTGMEVGQRARSTTTSSLPFATPEEDYKPYNFSEINGAPRSMTMPSSPANSYADLHSWSTGAPIGGSAMDMASPPYHMDDLAPVNSFNWI